MGRGGEWQSRDQTGYNGDVEKNHRNKEGGSFWFSPTVQTVPPDMNVSTDSGQNICHRICLLDYNLCSLYIKYKY